MGKAIVFSVLLATVVIPLVYARRPHERGGLKKTIVAFGAFCVVWVVATLFIAPRL
jgi:hypothetical protein